MKYNDGGFDNWKDRIEGNLTWLLIAVLFYFFLKMLVGSLS